MKITWFLFQTKRGLLSVENNLVLLQTKPPVLSKLVQEEDLGSPHKQIDHHSGGSQGSETEGILV